MVARLRHLRHRELDGLARDRLDRTKDALSLGIPAGRKPEFAFTADNITNSITITDELTLAAENPVVIVQGDLPAGLDSGVLYWLAGGALGVYTLHENKSDAVTGLEAIAFTTDGTGTLTMTILE